MGRVAAGPAYETASLWTKLTPLLPSLFRLKAQVFALEAAPEGVGSLPTKGPDDAPPTCRTNDLKSMRGGYAGKVSDRSDTFGLERHVQGIGGKPRDDPLHYGPDRPVEVHLVEEPLVPRRVG